MTHKSQRLTRHAFMAAVHSAGLSADLDENGVLLMSAPWPSTLMVLKLSGLTSKTTIAIERAAELRLVMAYREPRGERAPQFLRINADDAVRKLRRGESTHDDVYFFPEDGSMLAYWSHHDELLIYCKK